MGAGHRRWMGEDLLRWAIPWTVPAPAWGGRARRRGTSLGGSSSPRSGQRQPQAAWQHPSRPPAREPIPWDARAARIRALPSAGASSGSLDLAPLAHGPARKLPAGCGPAAPVQLPSPRLGTWRAGRRRPSSRRRPPGRRREEVVASPLLVPARARNVAGLPMEDPRARGGPGAGRRTARSRLGWGAGPRPAGDAPAGRSDPGGQPRCSADCGGQLVDVGGPGVGERPDPVRRLRARQLTRRAGSAGERRRIPGPGGGPWGRGDRRRLAAAHVSRETGGGIAGPLGGGAARDVGPRGVAVGSCIREVPWTRFT